MRLRRTQLRGVVTRRPPSGPKETMIAALMSAPPARARRVSSAHPASLVSSVSAAWRARAMGDGAAEFICCCSSVAATANII